MTQEEKKWIDEASLVVLLGKWRFSPIGDPYFRDSDRGNYFAKVMSEKRSADPDGWVHASKNLGWD
jgi:hypothetical protein